MLTESALQHIVHKIMSDYRPEKIILFGSYAYGRPDQDSDLDLLIIKETPEDFWERSFQVYQLVDALRRDVPFQPIVLTPRELRERLSGGGGPASQD